METFIDYCKNYIAEHLGEYEGQKVWACDLGYEITEGPNIDGTLTYSREEAKDYIREWWDEAADYWEYEKSNFGEHSHNPFEEPEAYMVCMVIEGVRALVDSALLELTEPVEYDDEEIELTAQLIEDIKRLVAENPTDSLF